MRELEVFNYKGNEVTFKNENGDITVNATEMAKPFGKKVKDWLRLNSTKEYLQVLDNQKEADLPISDNQLVIQKQGTPKYGGGTELHEDVALPFAQWLSAKYYVWYNSRIKELMKYEVTLEAHLKFIDF